MSKAPDTTKVPNPKRKSLARKILDTLGRGPFSGIKLQPPKRRKVKLVDPTKDVGKKIIRDKRKKPQ